MSEHKPEWPEFGELVIATIEKVMDYGAYAKLEEYNRQGLLHISEISSGRIRRIRDYVRENQKLVLKVIRVNIEKGHINLSLRRVTKRERIKKNKRWKKERKGEALLNEVAEKAGLPKHEVYQKAGAILEEKYGLYEGLEKVVKEGVEVLAELDIPEDLAKVITQVAEERILPVKYTTIYSCFKHVRKRAAKIHQNPKLLKISFVTFRHWGGTMIAQYTNGNVLRVQKLLGHKKIENTMKYSQLIQFKDSEYEVTSATTIEEAKAVLAAGFEYVTEKEGIMLFRKPKSFVSLEM